MTAFEAPTPTEPSWYVSRRIPVPTGDATRALGAALRADVLPGAMDPTLAIDGVRYLRPGEVRGFTGRLDLGRLRGTARVEVQVEPWSRSESAIGVRPIGRVPRARADRYFQRAIALIGSLESVTRAWAASPAPVEVRRAS